MLSMAATALVQAQGDENGTNLTVAPMAKADIPGREERDLLDNVDKMVGILVGLTVLYAFFRRRGKKVPSDDGGNMIENAKDSASSFGDHSTAIKADRIEGGVHITYPSPKEPTVAEKPLGKINNIPHSHNPNFTGRKDLLDRLSEALASGERAAFTQTQAITGLGGVGKTQLALEYSYRHTDDYQVIWWVRSEEPAALAPDYAGLAGRLDLPEKSSQDQRVTVEAVRCWLEQNGGWLLVFDNAQKPEDLNDYLPLTGKGHVIITSRNPNWGGTAKTLPVDVFSRDESIEFLQSRTGQKDGAETLAEALGNLPLALEQAGAYILATGINLADYLELFQTRRNELWKDEKKPESYREKVETAWTVSMDRVKEEATVGADLLNLCAFLAPDDIPRKLFSEGNEHLPESLADKLAVNRAVDALQRYSLINATPESLSVHRLVQAVARDRLSEEERKRWADAAVRLVNDAFPQKSQDVGTWSECSVLLPHALAAAGHSEGLEVAQKETQHILNQAGGYLFGRAEYKEAGALFERALPIAENVYGSDNNEVAAIINNIGMVLQEIGDLVGAKMHFGRALEMGEKAFGPENPEVATNVNNLGSVLWRMGDLVGAKKHFERALEIEEKAYSSDHPAVARDANNLGRVLKDLGDLKGAKRNYEQALEIGEKIHGPTHPNVATYASNLGNVFQDMGDLKGAKKHFERALKIHEKAYGPNHPAVAIDANNLGSVLYNMGDLAGAKERFEQALEIDENVYGQDHPNVAIWLSNIGSVLQAMGDLKGAKEHYERALKIDEKGLGPNHPRVAKDINNLGSVLKDMSDFEGAKERFERALEIGEKALGPDNPSVAIKLCNLGSVLQDMGDLEGAKERYERALKIDEKAYGPNHSNVAKDVNNLGRILQKMGDPAGAKEHYDRALKICLNRLGEDHPDTKTVRKNLESLRR